jgi:ABC-2 type transport system permease protein
VIALVRSELLKLRTTRTALSLIVGMVALVVLVTLLNGLVPREPSLLGRKEQFQLLANGSIASAFAAILGLMSVTTEIRHGTIRPTMLTTPRRTRVLVAKLIATTAFGGALGTIGVALSYGIGTLCLDARGIPTALTAGDRRLAVVGAIAVSALWGAFGVAVGAVIRNQVGAIVGGLIWVLFVESILFGLVPSVGRFLPATAANALTQIDTPHQLPVTVGVLLFCAYIAAAIAAAAVITERRDLP